MPGEMQSSNRLTGAPPLRNDRLMAYLDPPSAERWNPRVVEERRFYGPRSITLASGVFLGMLTQATVTQPVARVLAPLVGLVCLLDLLPILTVDQRGMTRRLLGVPRHIPWDAVARIEHPNNRLRVVLRNGRTVRIITGSVGLSAEQRGLDARALTAALWHYAPQTQPTQPVHQGYSQ